jgi:hypothetical protein
MNDQRIMYESEARGDPRMSRPGPREAAPRQALPPTNGPRLHRRRRTADPFYVDRRIIPEGFSYEWKAESIYGQPNSDHMIQLRENHWRPVPAARHPELAAQGETTIRRSGTILCERPSYLTNEARMEDIQEAMKPVQQKEELMYGTPPGQMTRNHPSVRNVAFVKQEYAPGERIELTPDGTYAEP